MLAGSQTRSPARSARERWPRSRSSGSCAARSGVWLVLYRQSYSAESLAHAALPGLVLASLAGLPLLVGAAGGLVVAAVRSRWQAASAGLAPTRRSPWSSRRSSEPGVLLALRPEVPARLGEILFGDPLSVSGAETSSRPAVLALAVHRRPRRPSPAARRSAASTGRRREASGVQPAGRRARAARAPGRGDARRGRRAREPAGGCACCWRPVPRRSAWLVVWARASSSPPRWRWAPASPGLYASYYLELAAGASIALAAVATFALAALVPQRSRVRG